MSVGLLHTCIDVHDANGNQITRTLGSDTYFLIYDAENRLVRIDGDMLFSDGFEGGGLSTWDGSQTGSGDLGVSGAAALEGGSGLQAVINDNGALYVQDDSPSAETLLGVQFRFDPNTITMSSGNTYTLWQAYQASGTEAARIEHRYYNGNHQLRAGLLLDSGAWSYTSFYNITDAPHRVRVEWQAATAAGANNGSLALKVDGALKQTLGSKDNDTRRVETVRLGVGQWRRWLDNGNYEHGR